MVWVLVDVVLALLALALLTLAALTVYRQVRVLLRQLAAASELVGRAGQLAASVQVDRPPASAAAVASYGTRRR